MSRRVVDGLALSGCARGKRCHVSWGLVFALVGVLAAGGCQKESSRPPLSVIPGPHQPANSIAVDYDDVPVLQIALWATRGGVEVSAIRFHASGSGHDAMGLTSVRIYHDVNGDGSLDGGDRLLATASGYSLDDGEVALTGVNESIPPTGRTYWLLVYDIAPGASAGETFCASLLSAADVDATVGGKPARVSVAAAIQGCVTASPGTVTLSPGPGAPMDRDIGECASAEQVFQIRIDAGPQEEVSIGAVTITASGTGDDSTHIRDVWLYADENGNGEFDAPDVPLGGPVAYPADDGVLDFQALGRTIPAGGVETWFLLYYLSGNVPRGLTFVAEVASASDLSVWGVFSGEPGIVLGAPLVGPENRVWDALLTSARYRDENENGRIDDLDTVTLIFNQEVLIQGWQRPVDVVLVDPPGALGDAWFAAQKDPKEVIIEFNGSTWWPPDIQPNGVYGLDPGASGVNLRFGQTTITDCRNSTVLPVPLPVDLEGELTPRITGITLIDANWNCIIDAGDRIDIGFSPNVTMMTADPSAAFDLLVLGDWFGSGASFLGGGAPTDVGMVSILLGTGAVLEPSGLFDPASLSPGSPSALDVSATPGLIVDAAAPDILAAQKDPPGVDLTEPFLWSSAGHDLSWANFGQSVASAGDVNGDGYGDVIVWGNAEAMLYQGDPGGLPSAPDWEMLDVNSQVACAGDVNGDGYSDVIVGASGEARVYLGGPGGLDQNPIWTSSAVVPAITSWVTVASAGDVNGDTYDDIIIGDRDHDAVDYNEGRALLFLGSAAGPSSVADWVSTGDDQRRAYFGDSVASAGDTNGDGYADVIIGASGGGDPAGYDVGKAFVYLGDAAGLLTTPEWTSSGDGQRWALFGRSVSTAGDINGDGFSDIIVGAYGDFGGAGKVYVYTGDLAGPSPGPVWTSVGENAPGAGFGYAVASAGDVDGDTFSDVIIGAFRFTSLSYEEGKAYVYRGGAFGLESTAAWESLGEEGIGAWFGVSVASAGDVNGDGTVEIIVGASGFDTANPNAGKAYIFCVGP